MGRGKRGRTNRRDSRKTFEGTFEGTFRSDFEKRLFRTVRYFTLGLQQQHQHQHQQQHQQQTRVGQKRARDDKEEGAPPARQREPPLWTEGGGTAVDGAARGGVTNSGERNDAGSETATRGAAAGGRQRGRDDDGGDDGGDDGEERGDNAAMAGGGEGWR